MDNLLWIFMILQWVFVFAILYGVVALYGERPETEKAINFILDYIREQQNKDKGP